MFGKEGDGSLVHIQSELQKLVGSLHATPVPSFEADPGDPEQMRLWNDLNRLRDKLGSLRLEAAFVSEDHFGWIQDRIEP